MVEENLEEHQENTASPEASNNNSNPLKESVV